MRCLLDLLVNSVSNTFIPLKVYRIQESFEMEQLLKEQRVSWLLDRLVNSVSNTFILLKVYHIHESFEMEQLLKEQRMMCLF